MMQAKASKPHPEERRSRVSKDEVALHSTPTLPLEIATC